MQEKAMELGIEMMSCTFGITIFTANVLLVVFAGRFLRGSKGNKDKRGIIIHLIFVSVNDMLSGFVIFIIGIARVYDIFSAYLCASMIYTGMALQTVSQGNITCICAQRYHSAINIRKLSSNKQAFNTKVLIALNAIIGGLCVLSFSLLSRVKEISEITVRLCSISSVVRGETALTSAAFFI